MFQFSDRFVNDVVEFFGKDMPEGLHAALEKNSYGCVRTILVREKDRPSASSAFAFNHRRARLQALYSRCVSEWTHHKNQHVYA